MISEYCYLLDLSENESCEMAALWMLRKNDDTEKFDEEQLDKERLKDNNAGKVLSGLFGLFKRQALKKVTFFEEQQYVERTYRDSYYTHFAGKHFDQSRLCRRYFLFAGDQTKVSIDNAGILQPAFIGTIVVRPTVYGRLGRTLINPTYMLGENQGIYIRTTQYKVLFGSHYLKVRAFPYMMQDNETITCAQVAILNTLDYYSNQYANYRSILPSDIQTVLAKYDHQRILPAHGMTYSLISRVLTEWGYFPRQYIRNDDLTEEHLKSIIHYYIESGVPLIIGLDGQNGEDSHSIVAIGHGRREPAKLKQSLYSISKHNSKAGEAGRFYIADTADSVDTYIVMDDGKAPYKEASFEDGQYGDGLRLGMVTVPLYRRMHLEALDARSIFVELLKSKWEQIVEKYIAHYGQSGKCQLGSETAPLIMRMFLASSTNLQKFRMGEVNPESEISQLYNATPFPKFVWVCELYDEEGYEKMKAFGEILLDATSSGKNQECMIMINLPRCSTARDYEGKFPEKALRKKEAANKKEEAQPDRASGSEVSPLYPINGWAPIDGYRLNLHEAWRSEL